MHLANKPHPPQSPVALAPALAAGCLLGAAFINHADSLPGTIFFQIIVAAAFCIQLLTELLAKRFSLPFASSCIAALLTIHLATQDARNWLENSLATACENIPLTLSVTVTDIPVVIDGQGRVIVETLPAQSHACGQLPQRISLGWTHANQAKQTSLATPWYPEPGQQWLISLKLKRPIATLNFDGFDVHTYWMEQGIHALGRITETPARIVTPPPAEIHDIMTLITSLRHTLYQRITNAVPEKSNPYHGILQGLSIGLQKHIPPSQWSTLSATGTSHLISISGMHVTLLAGWMAWLIITLWKHIPALALHFPAEKAAALISLPVATLYAALAGWGVPAQRTVFSLAMGTLVLLIGWRTRPFNLLCLACFAVVLSNPWCATSPGFLLSFSAVGVLVFSSAGRNTHIGTQWPALKRACAEHVTVFIGLMPLSVALFGQYSWVSPVANLLSIAWMSFITTPLILIGSLLDIHWLMQCAHASLQPLWPMLETLAQFQLAWSPIAQAPLAITLLSVAGGFMALMPSGLMLQTPGFLLACLPLFWPVQKPSQGEFEMTVLDIGQGNSIAVRTAQHTLLVDAGNASGPRNDQGRITVMPWLHHRGQRHWSAVLVSHNDSDHAGGMGSVLQASSTDTLYANLPFKAPDAATTRIANTRPCTAGTEWTWDGVQFSILYPSEADLHTETEDNALSCVLRISSPHGSALLPGDIGIEQELKIIERAGGAHPLKSDVVLVPHHGSETSSSREFVQATGARWAIFQVGYRNRYGHPKPDVTQTWAQQGARNLRTDHTGALRFRFTRQGITEESARQSRKRFWHLPPETITLPPQKPANAVKHRQKRRLHRSGAITSGHSLSE